MVLSFQHIPGLRLMLIIFIILLLWTKIFSWFNFWQIFICIIINMCLNRTQTGTNRLVFLILNWSPKRFFLLPNWITNWTETNTKIGFWTCFLILVFRWKDISKHYCRLSICLSSDLSTCLPVTPSTYLSTCLPVHLSTCLPVICVSIWINKIK